MIASRRSFLLGVVGCGTTLGRTAHAAPPNASNRRLRNRLELWENYARRTRNLTARLATTRVSSLLLEPLVTTGTLLFVSPNRLMLHDDGLTGSTTIVQGASVRIAQNGTLGTQAAAIDVQAQPAAAWLAARLVALFAAGDGSNLIADAHAQVPRGRGYRFELYPPRGSTTRKLIRSVLVTLDPVAGAVSEIAISEAQGDRLHLRISDHRQNLEREDVEASWARFSTPSR